MLSDPVVEKMTNDLASDVATHKSIPLLVHDQNLSFQIQESIPNCPVLSWKPFQSINTLRQISFV